MTEYVITLVVPTQNAELSDVVKEKIATLEAKFDLTIVGDIKSVRFEDQNTCLIDYLFVPLLKRIQLKRYVRREIPQVSKVKTESLNYIGPL